MRIYSIMWSAYRKRFELRFRKNPLPENHSKNRKVIAADDRGTSPENRRGWNE